MKNISDFKKSEILLKLVKDNKLNSGHLAVKMMMTPALFSKKINGSTTGWPFSQEEFNRMKVILLDLRNRIDEAVSELG